jgi:trans-aconitate methyltransferase
MNSKTIVDLNQRQEISEQDTFTPARYLSFVRHFLPGTKDVLDVGCNTGRGGAVMKSRLPNVRVTGLDSVAKRLAEVDRNVYQLTIAKSHVGAFAAVDRSITSRSTPSSIVLQERSDQCRHLQ